MAIPTFVAAGTVQSGTGGVTPGLPAGYAADDIFLLFCETAAQSVTTPSGWTIADDSPDDHPTGTGPTRLSCFWKRASASESAPAIADPGDHIIARILAFRGCIATGNPFDVSEKNLYFDDSGVSKIAGVSTSVADCLFVFGVSAGTDTASAQFDNWVNPNLSSVTERVDNFTTSGNGGGFAVTTGGKAAVGSPGDTSFDAVGAPGIEIASLVYALKPVASTTYNQSVLATTTPVSVTVRSTGKPTRATSTPVAATIRSTSKPTRASTTPVSAIIRSAGRLVRAATQPAATLSATRVTLALLQATTTLAATLRRGIGKLAQTATTPVASQARQTAKVLTGATTPVSTTARSTSKPLRSTTTPVSNLGRGMAIGIAISVAVVAVARKAMALTVQSFAGAVGSLFRLVIPGPDAVGPSISGRTVTGGPGAGRSVSAASIQSRSVAAPDAAGRTITAYPISGRTI